MSAEVVMRASEISERDDGETEMSAARKYRERKRGRHRERESTERSDGEK